MEAIYKMMATNYLLMIGVCNEWIEQGKDVKYWEQVKKDCLAGYDFAAKKSEPPFSFIDNKPSLQTA